MEGWGGGAVKWGAGWEERVGKGGVGMGGKGPRQKGGRT